MCCILCIIKKKLTNELGYTVAYECISYELLDSTDGRYIKTNDEIDDGKDTVYRITRTTRCISYNDLNRAAKDDLIFTANAVVYKSGKINIINRESNVKSSVQKFLKKNGIVKGKYKQYNNFLKELYEVVWSDMEKEQEYIRQNTNPIEVAG